MTWASMACYGDSFTFLLQFPILPTASLAYVNKYKGLVTNFMAINIHVNRVVKVVFDGFTYALKIASNTVDMEKIKITGTYYQN
jgi:hypothetical protein